jgi:hypothetical protein
MKPRKIIPLVPALLGAGEKAMMVRAVATTIVTELERGITTEAQVVYFLVQLRKLMEQHEGPRDYTAAPTKFFCDWALHPAITSQSGLALLKPVDQAFGKSTQEAVSLLGHTFSMEDFREHLIHQLLRHDLPVDAFRKMQPWLEFLRLYLHVIADTPIFDSKAKLRNFDRVQVRLDEGIAADVPPGAAFAFTVLWTFSKQRNLLFEWRNQVIQPINPKPRHSYRLSATR